MTFTQIARMTGRVKQGQFQSIKWPNLMLIVLLINGCAMVSSRKLTSEDNSYTLHKKYEALTGRIVYKNPRNAPSDSCPRDEEAIKRTGRKCLRKCNSDSDCLSRRKVCVCDGICGLTCIKPDRECGDLDNPVFGFVEFNGKLVGSQAKYKCQEGYHLIGQEYRRCQADGTWSSMPPECRENLYCTDPPLIPNAKHNGTATMTRFSVNSSLEFTCDHGYSTVGFNDAKCFLYNNTMQWFGPEMKCMPRSCGDPGEISNGQKDSDCYSFSCRLKYNCRPGFKLEGRNTLYCQQDGSWNPKDLPKCKPIKCEVPKNPDHGKAHFSSVYYNAVVKYECNYSYMIVGPTSRTCGPDMKWSGEEPQCVVSIAPAGCIVPTIENGRLSNETRPGTQVPHGSTITISCDDAYEISHTLPPSTCYNSTWTHYPHCHPARCKKLPRRPSHGMVIAPKTAHGQKARYRCKDGYRLQGSSTTICHFGNWTGRTPRCKIIYCPFPGYLTNGRVLLVGNMGMYDYRPYVRKVKNNRQIRYECNRGYFLSEGPPGATCIAGRWSPKRLPKCDPKLHPRVQWLKRSVSMADFLEFMNQTNHSTPLKAAVANTRNQIINSSLPLVTYLNKESEDQILGDDSVDDGNLESSGEGSTVQGLHHRDFVNEATTEPGMLLLLNTSNSYFDRNAELSNVIHKELDHKHYKPMIPRLRDDINHMFQRETKFKIHQKIKKDLNHEFRGDSSDEIQDSLGFVNKNKSQIRVLRSSVPDNSKEKNHKRRNEWKKIGKKASHCEELDTNESVEVEVLRAGRDLEYTYSSGARVRIRCLEGHGLNIGNKTAKCARGKWKPMKPECVTLPCLVPHTTNGHYEFNSIQIPEKAAIPHAEVIKFWCHDGYTVLGSNTLRCWYGDWTVTGQRPICQPNPCALPTIEYGGYLNNLEPGSSIEHGTIFSYRCQDGWLVNLPQITCHLGKFLPELPSCVTPAQATHIGNRLPQPMKLLSFSGTDVTLGGDITGIDLMSKHHSSCSPPTRIQGTVIFKNGQPLSGEERRFPNGSEVTFNCIANTMGEKTTWTLRCEDGSWVGQKSSTYCRIEEAVEEFHPENLEEVLQDGNKSCIWKKTQPTVVTFHGDLQLTEKIMEFQPGVELVSRCIDIGKYAFVGAVRRRCINGEWDGEAPTCFGLNRDYDYSLDRPPTILVRHKDGPIAQTNDGKLLVYPGTQLYLECLWVRRYGTPTWNVSHTHQTSPEDKEETQTDSKIKEKLRRAGLKEQGGGKYWTGWSTDALRNPQLEFRLALYTAHVGDSGKYTCTTPTGHAHTIELDIRRMACPPLEEFSLGPLTPRRSPQSTSTLNTVVSFSCGPGLSLIGPSQTKCLPSGKWSTSVPRCEKVRCENPNAPEKGRLVTQGPFSIGDLLEISCDTGNMLVGQPVIVCKPNGEWSADIPKCSQACTYPGIIISGTMSSVKFYYPLNDNVTYTCGSGFELVGEPTITCLDGGQWSAPVPSCLPK